MKRPGLQVAHAFARLGDGERNPGLARPTNLRPVGRAAISMRAGNAAASSAPDPRTYWCKGGAPPGRVARPGAYPPFRLRLQGGLDYGAPPALAAWRSQHLRDACMLGAACFERQAWRCVLEMHAWSGVMRLWRIPVAVSGLGRLPHIRNPRMCGAPTVGSGFENLGARPGRYVLPSATRSRSYVVCSSSGSTRVSPITVMKFASATQRGSTCR